MKTKSSLEIAIPCTFTITNSTSLAYAVNDLSIDNKPFIASTFLPIRYVEIISKDNDVVVANVEKWILKQRKEESIALAQSADSHLAELMSM